MTPEQWASWAGPAALTAFASVLWWLAGRLWARLDKQDETSQEIKAMLATELRGLDVRLTAVEAHLNLLRRV